MGSCLPLTRLPGSEAVPHRSLNTLLWWLLCPSLSGGSWYKQVAGGGWSSRRMLVWLSGTSVARGSRYCGHLPSFNNCWSLGHTSQSSMITGKPLAASCRQVYSQDRIPWKLALQMSIELYFQLLHCCRLLNLHGHDNSYVLGCKGHGLVWSLFGFTLINSFSCVWTLLYTPVHVCTLDNVPNSSFVLCVHHCVHLLGPTHLLGTTHVLCLLGFPLFSLCWDNCGWTFD